MPGLAQAPVTALLFAGTVVTTADAAPPAPAEPPDSQPEPAPPPPPPPVQPLPYEPETTPEPELPPAATVEPQVRTEGIEIVPAIDLVMADEDEDAERPNDEGAEPGAPA